jgi:hypothetical protein
MSTDPISLFRSLIDALNRGEWHAVAERCDPAGLARFKESLLAQFDPAEQPRQLTAEEYLRSSPDTPRAVVDHFVAEVNRRRADPAERLADEVAGVESVTALREMHPEAVFAAWLEGRSPRRQLERLIAEGQAPPDAADLLNQLAVVRHVAIGAVADGERLSHVVYRLEIEDPPDERYGTEERDPAVGEPAPEAEDDRSDGAGVYVASCRKQADGTWRMVPGFGFLNLASTSVSVGVDEEG